LSSAKRSARVECLTIATLRNKTDDYNRQQFSEKSWQDFFRVFSKREPE
jgi:hypothetical protein